MPRLMGQRHVRPGSYVMRLISRETVYTVQAWWDGRTYAEKAALPYAVRALVGAVLQLAERPDEMGTPPERRPS
jgi:hypothetical protein